jgi:hypothetical protein
MTDDDSTNQSRPTLVHVHVCVHCGYARRREEVDTREVGSGILHCPQCGRDGALNLEIREFPFDRRLP